MAATPDLTTLLPTGEIMARLGAATVVGAIIGLDREVRRKAAGLRTQALVALGCSTATLVISELAGIGDGYDVSAISRVIQGVLTGIGFLGGGAILRGTNDSQVQGLTTAASIWISATLGLACGVGLWRLAVVVMVLAHVVAASGSNSGRGGSGIPRHRTRRGEQPTVAKRRPATQPPRFAVQVPSA